MLKDTDQIDAEISFLLDKIIELQALKKRSCVDCTDGLCINQGRKDGICLMHTLYTYTRLENNINKRGCKLCYQK